MASAQVLLRKRTWAQAARRWFSLAAFGVALIASHASAQTSPLPSARIGAAPLVSIAASDGQLGSSTTHTNSLASFSYLGARPVEIVELADALNNDPDLIFDFVRNNIRTEFRYGLAKGALGALIDRSGTPFDQARLLVELLREAGFTANYVLGTLTPSAASFTNWTGVGSAQGACTLLAHGGIPGSVNGATGTCAFANGTSLTSVSMRHVWVTAAIAGTTYVFDPSFKASQNPTPINLSAIAGLTVGEIPSQAVTGSSTGTQANGPWVRNLNVSGVETNLRDSAMAVVTHIRAQSIAPELDTLAGVPTIIRENAPPGGWRLTSHPAGTAAVTWSEVPNVYRTKVEVSVDLYRSIGGTHLTAARTLYVDEFYGRRFQLRTNFDTEHNGQIDFQAWLEIDDVAIATFTLNCPGYQQTDGCFIPGGPADLAININHPYAANNGGYMDRALQRTIVFATNVSILVGVGTPSAALGAKWGGERLGDRLSPNVPPTCIVDFDTCVNFIASLQSAPTGDFSRQRMLASWYGQFGRASDMTARLYGGRVEFHNVLGFVYAVESVDVVQSPDGGPQPIPYSFYLGNRQTQIDMEPAYSVVASDGLSTRRRALAYSVAAIGASLEGSAFEQQEGAVDAASSPARLAWASAPADEDPSGAGSRRVYDFTNVADPDRMGLMQIEGGVTSSDPLIGAGLSYKTQLSGLINSYADAGFRVTASSESLLGPGARLGRKVWNTPCPNFQTCAFVHEPTVQRGGAVVAALLDASGDPLQIAHVMSTAGIQLIKGGGGEPASEADAFDPAQSADMLRDRFEDRSSALGVDLRSGAPTYSTPVLDSVGAGEPYGLSLALTYARGIDARRLWAPDYPNPAFTETGGGQWVSNWEFDFDIGSSGSNALGEHSAEAAAPSLVALWALSDVYASNLPPHQRDAVAAIVIDWWRKQFRNNSATYSRGASTVQFARLPDGSWQAPPGNFATLTQTGARAPLRPTCGGLDSATGTMKQWPAEARRWGNDAVDYTITLRDGVTIDVEDTFIFGGETPGFGGPTDCDRVYQFEVRSLTWPQGPVVTLSPPPATTITTSLGRSSSSLSATVSPNSPTGIMTIANAAGATWTYEFEPGHSASATQRPSIWPRLIRVWEPTAPNTNPTSASLRYVYDGRGFVREAYDAVAIQTPAQRQPHRFQIAGYGRGARVDPLNGTFSVVYDTHDRAIRFVDELGRLTTATYDGRGRVLSRTFPELDRSEFAYDNQDNPILFRRVAKPGAGLPDLQIAATWNLTWNRPASITDARGYRTDFTYHASGNGRSLLATAVRPAPSGGTPVGSGARPTYTYSYNTNGLLVSETDPTGRVTTHAYNSLGERTSTTAATTAIGGPALNLLTSFLYTADGDVSRLTDPRGNVTETTYDAMRRLRDVLHHNGGIAAPLLAAERSNYDLMGRGTSTQSGTAFSGSSVTAWLTRETRTYTPTGQVATIANGAGNVTTNFYDGLDRLESVTDPVGRVTRNSYDAASQLIAIQRAFGTPLVQDYARYTYSANGQRLSVRDANNNRSAFVYDGFDRLCRLYFPVTAMNANAANTGGIAESTLTCASGGTNPDYEGYGYDPNGNRVSLRLRSANSNPTANTLLYSYDNLNREILKNIPNGTAADVFSAYDVAGRLLSARFASTSGQGAIYAYDAAGRLLSETNTLGVSRALGFQYDAASNRVRITHPDGFFAQYDYDAMNRVSAIRENGAASGAGVLATYAYDPLSRRLSVTRGNGTVSTYGYDNASRLTSLAHDLDGASAVNDQSFSFLPTAASQLQSRSAANDNYNWTGATIANRAYVANGLNQYASVAGIAFGHDARGNLSSDGARSFSYDFENRLLSASGPTAASFVYDPLGRMFQVGTASTTTQFLYDGDRLTAEYNGTSATPLRRYVHGPGVDEPLVWYEGSGTTDRRHLIADHQGSMIAENGTATVRYCYGPYGEPNTWTGSRFRYTGQIALPEANLYHYKARVYDPGLGRFLQTDPVGYEDDLNLYAYVRNDPLNRNDASGTYGRGEGFSNEEWRNFDSAQRAAARAAERAATRLERAATALEGGGEISGETRRAVQDFEEATGRGNGTPSNLREAAGSFRSSAAALRGDESGGFVATGLNASEWASAGYSPDSMARAPVGGSTVSINLGHFGWANDPSRATWSIGHDSLHSAGLRDERLNNSRAYRFGGPGEQGAFRAFPETDPTRARNNVDNLLDFAQ